MKIEQIIKKKKIEQLSILFELTKGFDKYLILQLLNDYLNEINDILSSKYKTYDLEEEEGTIYLNKFYFNQYEYVCKKLYIHNIEIFFDINSESIETCWNYYDIIEILENILTDKHLNENEIKELPNSTNPIKTEKQEHIFAYNGFKIFNHLLENYIKPKGVKGRYSDISYFHRKLYNDNFIHQKPEPFRDWFINHYEEEFSKIKTLIATKNPQRERDYSTAIDWFKQDK